MKSALARAAVLGAIALGPLLVAAPALAHVTVSSASAVQGGYAKLTFRVPSEEADAKTTKIEVSFPTETPFASARVKPHAGWDFTINKVKLATPLKDDDGNEITEGVGSIVWTAKAGSELTPTEFDEFDISVGPLPTVDKLVFKALQTYSNGEIVRWIETGENAEHPAPTLTLAPATGDAHGGHTTASPSASPGATVTATEDSGDDKASDSTARTLGIIGIALGAVGLTSAAAARKKKA